jgi:hypothetical protein
MLYFERLREEFELKEGLFTLSAELGWKVRSLCLYSKFLVEIYGN